MGIGLSRQRARAARPDEPGSSGHRSDRAHRRSSSASPAERRRIVETRLKGIEALPALPGIIAKLLELLSDPDVTAEDLERGLMLDPALVQRLFAVARSPAFAPTRGGDPPTSLRDVIVRLGLREVAAIVMQAKLAGSFARSHHTLFDYKRFWAHSVSCALASHKLLVEKHLDFADPPQFHNFWIAGLLHDIGKLVMGVYFWDHFALVMGETVTGPMTFRKAEQRVGDATDHAEIGQLFLERSHMSPEVCEAVGHHQEPSEVPGDLECLLHVADYICNTLGFSFPLTEALECSPIVLQAIGRDQEQVNEISEKLSHSVRAQVKELLRDVT